MAINNVNVGAAPDDHTGDVLRNAFIKVNESIETLLILIGTKVSQTVFNAAMADIDNQISNLQTQIYGKANLFHTHQMDQIVGLVTALNSKVNTSTFNAAINGINNDISAINAAILELQVCCDYTSNMGLQEILDNGASATIAGDIFLQYDDIRFNGSEFFINSIHPGNEPVIVRFQRNGNLVAGVRDTGRVFGEDAEELDEFVTLRQLNAGGGGGSGSTYTTDGSLYISDDFVIGLNVSYWEDNFIYSGGSQTFTLNFEANLFIGVTVNGQKLLRFVQYSASPTQVTILDELDENDVIIIAYQKYSNPIN